MPIEGPLRELSLQDVLQLLELAGKTGVLTVRSERENDEGVLHLERGRIVFARRRRSGRRLGQQLLRSGKLTERELERALALQRRDPHRHLSEILVEMGSVAENDLAGQLAFQLTETVHDLIGWEEGHFRFEERADVFHGAVPVRLSVESLLMEGARRVDEWSRLESRIPSLQSVPVLAPADVSRGGPLELRAEEWEVLAEIDGERDIARIAAELGRSTFDVGRIVFGLVSNGVVRVEERHSRIPEHALRARLAEAETLLAHGEGERAERLAEELEASHPDRAEVALVAGLALAAQGRLRAATEAFARSVALDPLDAAGHLHLGRAATRIGDFTRAAAAWRLYLRLAPGEPQCDDVERGLAAVRTLIEVLELPSADES